MFAPDLVLYVCTCAECANGRGMSTLEMDVSILLKKKKNLPKGPCECYVFMNTCNKIMFDRYYYIK